MVHNNVYRALASLACLSGLIALSVSCSPQPTERHTLDALVSQTAQGEDFFVLSGFQTESEDPSRGETRLFKFQANPKVQTIDAESSGLCLDSDPTTCLVDSRFFLLQNNAKVRLDEKKKDMPVDKQLGVDPGARLLVSICRPTSVRGQDISACMNEAPKNNAFQNEFNARSDISPDDRPSKVAQAVSEAILLLTMNDRVPQCYQAAVSEVEKFETGLFDDNYYTDNVFRTFRRLTRLNDPVECGADRNLWTSASCLNSLDGQYYNALAEEASRMSPETKESYRQRYLLGKRLNFTFNPPDTIKKLEYQAYLPADLAKDSAADKGEKFLTEELGKWLRTDTALLVQAGQKPVSITQGNDGWTASVNPDEARDAALHDLLYHAILLAKATQLEPLARVAEFEKAHNISISCQDVANYKFGMKSNRFNYVETLKTVTAPAALSEFPRVTANLRSGKDNREFGLGQTVKIGETNCASSNGYCGLKVELSSGASKDFRRYQAYRATLRRNLVPAYVTAEKVLPLNSSGIFEILSPEDVALIIEKKIVTSALPLPAALHIEGKTSTGTWELLRSERSTYAHSEFTEKCISATESVVMSQEQTFFKQLSQKLQVPSGNCAALNDKLTTLTVLDLRAMDPASIMGSIGWLKYFKNLKEIDLRGTVADYQADFASIMRPDLVIRIDLPAVVAISGTLMQYGPKFNPIKVGLKRIITGGQMSVRDDTCGIFRLEPSSNGVWTLGSKDSFQQTKCTAKLVYKLSESESPATLVSFSKVTPTAPKYRIQHATEAFEINGPMPRIWRASLIGDLSNVVSVTYKAAPNRSETAASIVVTSNNKATKFAVAVDVKRDIKWASATLELKTGGSMEVIEDQQSWKDAIVSIEYGESSEWQGGGSSIYIQAGPNQATSELVDSKMMRPLQDRKTACTGPFGYDSFLALTRQLEFAQNYLYQNFLQPPLNKRIHYKSLTITYADRIDVLELPDDVEKETSIKKIILALMEATNSTQTNPASICHVTEY